MNDRKVPKKGKNMMELAGSPFLFILIATIALILSLMIGLVVVMLTSDDHSGGYVGDGGGAGGKNKGDASTTQSSVPVGNMQALYISPSQPKRSSYLASTQGMTQIDGIGSQNAVLIELDGFTAVAGKNADAKIYPASMTKVMTLLVACEQLAAKGIDLNEALTVEADMIQYAYSEEGSGKMKAQAKAGDSFRINDLLYLIAWDSDTISCQMIAKHLAGSEAGFVALMNQKAAQLGLANTKFANSTGLHDQNNYSTCREIAAIMAATMDNPHAWSILKSTSSRQIRSTNSAVSFTIHPAWFVSKNRFNSKNALSTVTVMAGKTGYIDQSGASLVSYAEGQGKAYISVVCNSGSAENSTKDVKQIYNTFAK